MDDYESGQQGDWRDSESYAEALRDRQRGDWQAALALLEALKARYPDETGLDALIADTQLRMGAQKGRSARGRRWPKFNRRTAFIPLLVVTLVLLGLITSQIYQNVIGPSLTRLQGERQQADLAKQAQDALTAGAYAKVLETYDQLAALNPTYAGMAEGRAKAEAEQKLDEAYTRAVALLAAGQVAEAQAALIGIQQTAPTYRDVVALLAKVERQQRLTSLLTRAKTDEAAGNWDGVIVRLEEARTLAQSTERTQLDADLYRAYMAQAAKLVQNSAGGVGELNQAVLLYGKALSLKPGAGEATTARARVRQYLAGHDAFVASRWDSAIAQLEPLYNGQPDFLDGQAARMLYDAYVRSAEVLLGQDEKARAWERYNRAALVKGVDTSGARVMAASLGIQLTPTPTPSPTVTPTPAPSATIAPTAAPTPGYVALSRYRGKIVFWSTRSDRPTPTPIPGTPVPQAIQGEANLWIMDADGKNAFRIWQQDKAQEEYKKLREAELRSPDGLSWLYVTKPRNEKLTQIYVQYPNGKSLQLTSIAGMNYDPVWSPKGHWIAFVTNETGNDEIFLIGADGEYPKRLTWNDWEWDKHPSWSPEGNRLVFWSNRIVGYGQIWLMNDDGTGQMNLSNNKFEETDPIWIK